MTEKYIAKKLAPFKSQQENLEKELKSIKDQLHIEEEANDKYFNELTLAEKKLDEMAKESETLQRNIQTRQAGVSAGGDQNQNLDQQLEDKVKLLLSLFLLRESKKEKLELMLEIKKEQAIQEEENEEENDDDDGIKKKKGQFFILRIKVGEKLNAIEVPDTVRTFSDLRLVLANYCMVNAKQVFFTDQLGNLIQFNMKILDSLYPPVYDLLRNYEPLIGVDIIRPKKQEQQIIYKDDETEHQPFLTKTIRMEQRRIQKIDWTTYLGYLSTLKYIFESILFMVMLACFLYIQIDSKPYQENNQLYQGAKGLFVLDGQLENPIVDLAQFIRSTLLPKDYIKQPHELFPTTALKAGLVIQKLVTPKPFNQCKIYNEKQKQIFTDKNQSCIDYQQVYTTPLELAIPVEGKGKYDPTLYNLEKNGYLWELNTTNQEDFTNDVELIRNSSWLSYTQDFTTVLINYYNAPTNKIIQVKVIIDYIFFDEYLNRNTIIIQIFDLNYYSQLTQSLNMFIFYIAIILLVFSVFDFFSIQLNNSNNNLIIIYREIEKLEAKFKKLKNRNQIPHEQELAEYNQKKMIIEEFWILNIKVIFLIIKKPLIFDYIYMITFLGMLVRDSINQSYFNEVNNIDIRSNEFQDTQKLEGPLLISKIFSAVLSQFLMISVVRFLGNWSPYLRCYGLVMIRFNKQSWFLLLVLIFIIAICAMSWIITIQGQLIGHTDFIYAFIGLLRCTLRYGMHNDIDSQNLHPNVRDNISYSFETRYIQYIIVIVISMVMIPIFISLMTQQVHNTKEEAKEKMLEMKKQKQPSE